MTRLSVRRFMFLSTVSLPALGTASPPRAIDIARAITRCGIMLGLVQTKRKLPEKPKAANPA